MQVTAYAHKARPLMKTLPKLLEKVYDSGLRAVVHVSEEQCDAVDAQLWTYTPLVFLPHGTKKMGMAERQPIWITSRVENPNKAEVLVLADTTPDPSWTELGFGRILDLYCEDNMDSEQRFEARRLLYQQCNYPLTVWRDSPYGSWEKLS